MKWLALVVALAGCHAKHARNPADNAVVIVTSNVRDAQVFLDGRFIAPLVALHGGMAIEPGTHRIELRREDYFSRYLEVRLGRAEHTTVELPLAAILP